jgi:4-hydroxy-2-oxoheptanedioate aldolase
MNRISIALWAFVALAAGAGVFPCGATGQEGPVRLNRTIETLEKGEPVFGLFTGNFSLANARALARSGLDYVLIDMEHAPLDFETLNSFLLGMTDKAAIARQGHAQMATTPIVRIPVNGRNDPEWMVKQVLDMGVFGVMFPYIETRAEAERAIRSMRYPQPRGSALFEPVGLRGSSPTIASWYWGAANYSQVADLWPLNPRGELLAVLQIESAEGVRNAEAIVTTPGVGAIFVGPADLALSMGVPGSSPEVQAAIDSVLALCVRHNVPCGITSNAGTVAGRLEQGFRFPTVGYWGDAGIGGGVAEALRVAREAAGRND